MLRTLARAWASFLLSALLMLGALAGCALADTGEQPERERRSSLRTPALA